MSSTEGHCEDQTTTSSLVARAIEHAELTIQQWSESSSMQTFTNTIHVALISVGAEQHCPSALAVCRSLIAIIVTLLVYYFLFGNRHVQKRQRLAFELQVAEAKVQYLQEKLRNQNESSRDSREIRIFMDGAFDLLHYGHMNAFRLGRSLGTHLVVGVNSDESITLCKGGAPLMNDQERLTMVHSCKFVDEVVPGCPYIMNREYLEYVIEKYNIDYVIHGDDPCIVDGKDVYASAKQAGKFRTIPRTEGVSTTDIVGRMLLMTKEHHYHNDDDAGATEPNPDKQEEDSMMTALLGRQSKFLTTGQLLRLFSAGTKPPTKGMRIIYIDGAWDMFHCGHVAILKAARERGDYLIVGIHGDAVVNAHRGTNLPLMNLHERVLSVLSCRYVDDVLIDAPYNVTPEMVASLDIAEVVHGTQSDDIGVSANGENGERYKQRYKYPREAGIFSWITSPSHFNLGSIVGRIQKNQEVFQAKFERKIRAENDFYKTKYNRAISSSASS